MEYVKSNRPAIAVDLDDVVFPCAEGLVAAYNEHYGTNFQPNMPQSTWDVPQEEVQERFNGLQLGTTPGMVKPGWFEEMQVPDRETIEALRRLAATYRLYAVSARHYGLADVTQQSIEKYLPDVFEEVILTRRPVETEDGIKIMTDSKTEIYRQHNMEVAIDDSPHHLERGLAGDDAPLGLAILFGERPWHPGATIDDPRAIECRTWAEAEEAIARYFAR